MALNNDAKYQSLNQLLQWSIANSSPEALAAATASATAAEGTTTTTDTSSSSAAPSLEPIDPKWLDAMFPDEAKKMKETLVVLANTEASLDERELALEDLLFMVENIDAASDLCRIDGVAPLLMLVRRTEAPPSLRIGAAWVLATASQNNPFTQEIILNHGGMATAVGLLDDLASVLVGGSPSPLDDDELPSPLALDRSVAPGEPDLDAIALAKKLLSLVSALIEHRDGLAALLAAADDDIHSPLKVLGTLLHLPFAAQPVCALVTRTLVLVNKLFTRDSASETVAPALNDSNPLIEALVALVVSPGLDVDDYLALAEAAVAAVVSGGALSPLA
ncbi:uncharacterized protein AMSG_09034 [Thecamonas trahens ATCC 50062]|uniref:Nucleotide exchange factor Fes1 domain-containing protein n=1 Tax=Thecamonas trahens ATCC 50062 TaxID=461836 RepID=A0A0L0DKP1_THETB|nr:hypothetical protein AMSG_09034 [Thecamonas trahens ATCC 50062]KNC52877.1 hypothetical protein AMSG_09034 [Thecamonas trahens ATCC 50062]|eukprot:XP_013754976.1 hypothetical protein AMSG_09034 [Thecamonas trahens ATCC 50062]